MKRWIVCIALSAGGCAPYFEAQSGLVAQARRGIELATASAEQSRQRGEQIYELRRRRLDEAFDADVRQRSELSADWVIGARRAYGAGLDALAEQQRSQQAADAVMADNLRATDAALERLQWLQEIASRWLQRVGKGADHGND